jgi:hypothetical protein
MQRQPRYTLVRRILFPYSGEEPLTRKQGLRVIGVWALFFSCALFLCTLPMALAFMGTTSTMRIVMFLLITFFSEVVIFGALAWLVVIMNNRSAQFMLQRKAAGTGSTNGGRYGS